MIDEGRIKLTRQTLQARFGNLQRTRVAFSTPTASALHHTTPPRASYIDGEDRQIVQQKSLPRTTSPIALEAQALASSWPHRNLRPLQRWSAVDKPHRTKRFGSMKALDTCWQR